MNIPKLIRIVLISVSLIGLAALGYFIVYPWHETANMRHKLETEFAETWDYTEAFKLLSSGDERVSRILAGALLASQDKAVKWWLKKAREGDVDAQYILAICYLSGFGGKISPAEAVKWFRKAAEQGHLNAQFELADHYRSGWGVKKDETEVEKWRSKAVEGFREAAERGIVSAQVSHAFQQEDRNEKRKWLLKAAEQGDLSAYIFLAYVASKDEDRVEMFKWIRKAAEQGSIEAQLSLGNSYAQGRDVEQDHAEAVKWYRKVAEQKSFAFTPFTSINVKWYHSTPRHHRAQMLLGQCYEEGKGVEKNIAEALKWYRRAAEYKQYPDQKAIDAIKRLEALEKKGSE